MAERIPCKHCNESGTCKVVNKETSCEVCVHSWNKRFQPWWRRTPSIHLIAEKEHVGLVCAVCSGRGSVEPTTLKIANRFAPALAAIFVGAAFVLVFWFAQKATTDHFDKILAFASTLIGTITGYYFAGKKDE